MVVSMTVGEGDDENRYTRAELISAASHVMTP